MNDKNKTIGLEAKAEGCKHINKNGRKKADRFSPTNITNVLLHRSGTYYLNAFIGGEKFRESLGTKSEAEVVKKRDDRVAEIRKSQEQGNTGKETLTLRAALEAALKEYRRRNELKSTDPEYLADKTLVSYTYEVWRIGVDVRTVAEKKAGEEATNSDYALPAELLDRSIRKVIAKDLKSWFHRIKKDFGATVINTARVVLVDAYDIALVQGACLVNHAKELKGIKQAPKDLTLATQEQWAALIASIANNGATQEEIVKRQIVRELVANYRPNVEIQYEKAFAEHPDWPTKLGVAGVARVDASGKKAKVWQQLHDIVHYVSHREKDCVRRGQESADRVIFLSYTGARAEETAELTFDNIDFERNVITFPRESVKGQTRTKVLDIHPDLLPVLRRCQDRAKARSDNQVFAIKCANKAIANACKRLGFPHWSEHDFRHLFATELLIDGAAPIQVGYLLGHSDNGKTAGTRYAHACAARAKGLTRRLKFGVVKQQQSDAERIAALEAELAALKAQQPKNVIALAG